MFPLRLPTLYPPRVTQSEATARLICNVLVSHTPTAALFSQVQCFMGWEGLCACNSDDLKDLIANVIADSLLEKDE